MLFPGNPNDLMNEQLVSKVYFDMGGVLFADGSKQAVNDLIQAPYFVEPDVVRDVYYGPESWELRAGTIDGEYFWSTLEQRHSLSGRYPHINFRKEWYDRYVLNTPVFEIVQSLKKAGYETGVISGNFKDRVDYLEEKYGFRKFFDNLYFSYEFGENKVSGAFLTLSLKRISEIPGQILYFDDKEKCVEEARMAGVHAYIYTGVESVRRIITDFSLLKSL